MIFSRELIAGCGGNVIEVMSGKPLFSARARGQAVHIVSVKKTYLAECLEFKCK
jgi:hypothetical protein